MMDKVIVDGERKITAIMVEADLTDFDIFVENFDIARETEKMVYPVIDDKNQSRRTIRYLSQMRKGDMGVITDHRGKYGFKLQVHNIYGTQSEFERAYDKIMAIVEEELIIRRKNLEAWEEKFNERKR
jgi:hypothetical protein